jgi:hypothetical protein
VSSRGSMCLVSPAEHVVSRLPQRSDEDPDEVSYPNGRKMLSWTQPPTYTTPRSPVLWSFSIILFTG